MSIWIRSSLLTLCSIFATLPTISGQDTAPESKCEFFERYSDWPEDLRIPGSLLLADSVQGFSHYVASIEKSPKKNKAWCIVGPLVSARSILGDPVVDKIASSLNRIAWVPDIKYLQDLDPETMLLICEDRAIEEISPETWESIGRCIKRHLDQGAMVGFVGSAGCGLGKRYLKSGVDGRWSDGLGILPDGVIHFTPDGQCDRSLCDAIRPGDRNVLLSIASGSAWVLDGRKGLLYGPGVATAWVGDCEHTPASTQRIEARTERNRNEPESFLIDWTQWRRRAIERTLEIFPPVQRQIPHVANGSLMIVGGGGMPPGLMKKFVELAGGAEARIVYVPCAEEEDMSSDTRLLEVWTQMGAKRCSLLHTKDRRVADQDQSFLEPLKDATGIWFGGGRQWNLADSYYGTQAHRLMKQVLDRGGVIGGSSAGASIQGNYLARATPIENFRIMAPGYERGGLGFLSGVAIDQHFTQRRRQKDLRSLVETYPQMLGIGIDETTAILVRESQAEVIGPGTVTFNWKDGKEGQVQEFVGVQGQYFDLENRILIATP